MPTTYVRLSNELIVLLDQRNSRLVYLVAVDANRPQDFWDKVLFNGCTGLCVSMCPASTRGTCSYLGATAMTACNA